MKHWRIDEEAVIEFLGEVPLLQRLPSSSLRKIAELVQVRHYGRGREGLYLIWDGKACLSGSVDVMGGNHSEIQLKQYDHFGYCATGSDHEGSDICINQAHLFAHLELGAPRSRHISWAYFTRSSIIRTCFWRAVDWTEDIQLALAAATKTVGYHKLVHSLHSYFLIAGDTNLPIIYEVCRTHDGYNIATRRVTARQHGVAIFILVASFRVHFIKQDLSSMHYILNIPVMVCSNEFI
ncbi:hypothetical protein J5N97_023058 [Dioscorea zingiberensis]|uniref:Acyl-CoA thioesterase-like N-terminal HotDog domain-containing protein n=1 Tax=Dioscorea zingiberensis TaxID=325984 RepID=A0A9D5CBQ7_9LILI|nr:hypothetical protein J5N97_023058 [Dioscorea zingiberensis]